MVDVTIFNRFAWNIVQLKESKRFVLDATQTILCVCVWSESMAYTLQWMNEWIVSVSFDFVTRMYGFSSSSLLLGLSFFESRYFHPRRYNSMFHQATIVIGKREREWIERNGKEKARENGICSSYGHIQHTHTHYIYNSKTITMASKTNIPSIC